MIGLSDHLNNKCVCVCVLQFCTGPTERCAEPHLHTTHSLVQRAGLFGDEGGSRH